MPTGNPSRQISQIVQNGCGVWCDFNTEMVTDDDYSTWMRQNGLLAANIMACYKCVNHTEEKNEGVADKLKWQRTLRQCDTVRAVSFSVLISCCH